MEDTALTLNNIRAEIIGDAVNDKRINNLQLSEVARFVFGSAYFEIFDNLLRKTLDYNTVYKEMKRETYLRITRQENLN